MNAYETILLGDPNGRCRMTPLDCSLGLLDAAPSPRMLCASRRLTMLNEFGSRMSSTRT
ncbi:MAG: hypothetical protein JO039_16080 [Solirubrobacterales bacterium]|nr:hypothetical protein [Solirubrobacterales bacterium]